MKSHKEVGSVYNLDLQSQGSFADVLVRRENEMDAPLILGQFVILTSTELPDKMFLSRVETFRPDQSMDLNIKEAQRQSQKYKRELDKNYKEGTLFLSYRLRVLGVCEEEKGSIKFYSNVRSMPAVTTLKVAIPSSEFITNLFKSAVEDSEDGKMNSFEIGTLKYGTFPEYTKKFYDEKDPKSVVPVQFNAANLLRKRTGIFGKSGYGKSNTVKTVIGMMATKFPDCGQLIFDTNGEYALENDQNDGFMDIFAEAGIKGKCVLYTARKIHAEKKQKFGSDSFKPLRFDVFENVTAAMDIVVSNLAGGTIPMYLQAWVNEAQGIDDQNELFANVQNKGIVWGLWFKACMDAGMMPLKEVTNMPELKVSKKFLNEVVRSLNQEEDDENLRDEDNEEQPEEKADNFDSLSEAEQKTFLADHGIVRTGEKFFTRNIKTMAFYADWYADQIKAKEKKKKKGEEEGVSNSQQEQGASSVKGYIEILQYYRRLYQLKAYNIGQLPENERKGAKSVSLGDAVWQDLKNKKIVIIDLASVPGNVAKSLSEQIAANLLNKASNMFGDTEQQENFKNFDILCFIEEAQNYLSSEQVKAGSGIYERLAKEGRKFHIGLVYVTQQPSAIDEKITSQTENIIAMHMSNSADTMMLNRIKDKFDELTCKFLKDEAQKGLAYLYAEPHQPFVLPAQIYKFDKELILSGLKKSRK